MTDLWRNRSPAVIYILRFPRLALSRAQVVALYWLWSMSALSELGRERGELRRDTKIKGCRGWGRGEKGNTFFVATDGAGCTERSRLALCGIRAEWRQTFSLGVLNCLRVCLYLAMRVFRIRWTMSQIVFYVSRGWFVISSYSTL